MVLSESQQFNKLPRHALKKQRFMLATGQNIRAIRELKNYTQDYVAAHLNMSVSNYSNIENGKTDITLSRLQLIATVLQVEYIQILSFNRTQFLTPGTGISSSPPVQQPKEFSEALIRQLQIKDEQISRLLEILATNQS
jgi:transcriptional regulator with XRE-family HTH domain